MGEPMSEVTGLVANIQHMCVQNGPGIRTTVYLKGCPLSCFWCRSPEKISHRKEVWCYLQDCIACSLCVLSCPENVIEGYHDGRMMAHRLCLVEDGCTECKDACPRKAISIVGRQLSVETVLNEVLNDAAFYRRSGGGMCLSGGEPLLQGEFSKELLKGCQEHLIDTVLETSCFARWSITEEVARYANLLIIDIKHMDAQKHCEGTGVSNTQILSNITKLAKMGKNIRIRLPIIPGFNDSRKNLQKTAEFMVDNDISHVDLISFRTTNESLFMQHIRSYSQTDLKVPEADAMAEHRILLDTYGLMGTIDYSD